METDKEKEEIIKKVSFDFTKFEKFIKTNKDFVESETAAGIFGLGVLVSLVFSMQQASIGSTPFEKKLKGLNITSKDVQRIFVESLSKINQYSFPNTYKDLREFIAANICNNSTQIEKMSTQVISFNFVCGLELGRKFKSEKTTD